MTNIAKSLMWAGIIIGTAYLARTQGMSDNAAFGIVAGLSGAAVASLFGGKRHCELA